MGDDLPVYFMKQFLQNPTNLLTKTSLLPFTFNISILPEYFEEQNDMLKFYGGPYYPMGGILQRFTYMHDGYAIIFENGECYIAMDCEKTMDRTLEEIKSELEPYGNAKRTMIDTTLDVLPCKS